MAKEYTKKCDICCKTFTSQRSYTKYCPSCRVIAKKKQDKERNIARKNIARNEGQIKKSNREKNLNKTLSDLQKYNKKNGTNLSYGQFMAIKK